MSMTNTELIFKNNLIELRKEHSLTGYKIAKEIGINVNYYYRLEREETNVYPGFEILEKIAAYYGIEVYELFMQK